MLYTHCMLYLYIIKNPKELHPSSVRANIFPFVYAPAFTVIHVQM
jgi:hypothetical protein